MQLQQKDFDGEETKKQRKLQHSLGLHGSSNLPIHLRFGSNFSLDGYNWLLDMGIWGDCVSG